MAEAAGLVLGAVALSSLLSTCIEYFEYFEAGRNFGIEYERKLVKLEILRLRLQRWGDAVLLPPPAAATIGNATTPHHHQRTLIEDDPVNAQNARRLLDAIKDAFDQAEREADKFDVSKPTTTTTTTMTDDHRYIGDTNAETTALAVVRPSPSGSSSAALSLRSRIREAAGFRRRRTPLAKKVVWVLAGAKRLDRLVGDIKDYVDGLCELFPPVAAAAAVGSASAPGPAAMQEDAALRPVARQLVEEEYQRAESSGAAAEAAATRQIALLEEAASGTGPLAEMVREEADARAVYRRNVNEAGPGGDIFLGDEMARGARRTGFGALYEDNQTKAWGGGKVTMGSRYL